MKTYIYEGPSDGMSHTALVAEARAEARVYEDHHDWELDSADWYHGEIKDEKGKPTGPEARIVMRAV